MSKLRLDTIEKIRATSTPIATNDVAEIKAAERASAKVAPCHLSENSVGDAVLIGLYAEGVAADPVNEHVFVCRYE